MLFWLSKVCVCLQSLCRNFIDVHIKEESGVIWRVTFVYGEPKTKQQYVFWDRLRFLKAQWKGPWVCIGDFNEVLSSKEHLGPTNRGEAQTRLFHECLEDCQLLDLGFCGPKYTWSNKQQGDHNIRVRLDRAIANGQFHKYLMISKLKILLQHPRITLQCCYLSQSMLREALGKQKAIFSDTRQHGAGHQITLK